MTMTQHLCIRGWLVVLRINVDLAIFQPYLDLEAGDNKSLKIQVANPGSLAPKAKSLTTRPPLPEVYEVYTRNAQTLFRKGQSNNTTGRVQGYKKVHITRSAQIIEPLLTLQGITSSNTLSCVHANVVLKVCHGPVLLFMELSLIRTI